MNLKMIKYIIIQTMFLFIAMSLIGLGIYYTVTETHFLLAMACNVGWIPVVRYASNRRCD